MAENKKISKHQFYFETPLYEAIDLAKADTYLFSGEVDAYSARNGIDTTYKVTTHSIAGRVNFEHFGGFGMVRLTCKRKDNDVLCFFILHDEENKIAIKVGQWLSLVDIQFAEIGKKYDKHMERKDLQEYKKAIGLAAHGVGVGSFVYLRRVFANLIDETYASNQESLGLEESEYRKLRMDGRVNALAAYLPSQLVEMKSVYGILSKGLHELTEEECLAYFSVLRLAIELILEQKIEQDIKKQRDKAVKTQLAEIDAKLKGKATEEQAATNPIQEQ